MTTHNQRMNQKDHEEDHITVKRQKKKDYVAAYQKQKQTKQNQKTTQNQRTYQKDYVGDQKQKQTKQNNK